MNADRPDHGFAPIARADARILILGSMPSQQSLDQQQYYGNPQNAFWKIIGDYTGVAADAAYAQRVNAAVEARIAIWDVIKTCIRPGSLDAAIKSTSIEVNDFQAFFSTSRHIRGVFLNGGKAAQEYQRRVLPSLTHEYASLPRTVLLSTSPANARYSLAAKKENWTAIREGLESI